MSDDRESIVLPQPIEAVVGDVVGKQTGMVALDERRLQPCTALRIPVQGHHVGQVDGTAPDAPGIPVDKVDAGCGVVTRVEKIPDVRIAVGERVGRVEALRRVQTFSRVEHARIVRSGSRPEPVAERLCEVFVASAIVGSQLRQRHLVEERAYLPTEPRVAPPEGVEDRPRVHDALARLDRRRKRPLGENHVRLR